MKGRDGLALVIFIISVVVIMLTLITIILRKYKNELTSKDWYNEYQYEYQSVDCPHEKIIKLKDTDWRFAFTMKKEKYLKVNVAGYSTTIHQYRYRFNCEECGRRRWFKQTNSVLDHKGLLTLRLKYLAIVGVTIMLTVGVSLYLLAILFLE